MFLNLFESLNNFNCSNLRLSSVMNTLFFKNITKMRNHESFSLQRVEIHFQKTIEDYSNKSRFFICKSIYRIDAKTLNKSLEQEKWERGKIWMWSGIFFTMLCKNSFPIAIKLFLVHVHYYRLLFTREC